MSNKPPLPTSIYPVRGHMPEVLDPNPPKLDWEGLAYKLKAECKTLASYTTEFVNLKQHPENDQNHRIH